MTVTDLQGRLAIVAGSLRRAFIPLAIAEQLVLTQDEEAKLDEKLGEFVTITNQLSEMVKDILHRAE